jgi:hypothetical protein
MTNKEVVDRLQKFYLEQVEHKIVAEMLANSIVDFNRFLHLHELPEEEQQSLIFRIKANIESLYPVIEGEDIEIKTMTIVKTPCSHEE